MEAAIGERVEQFKALEAEEEREAAEEGSSVYEQMTELILDGCSIRNISSADAALLSNFTNLTKLGLNQTGLSSLANLPVMPSVRSLEATDNHLSCGLEKLAAAFPNLKKLQLGGNHLKTLEDVKPLAELKQLEHLGLDLNPVASLPDYRESLFSLIPSLVVLDSQDRNGKDCDAPDSDEEEEEDEEVDTTLRDFYEVEMPEEDAEDAEDFEPQEEALEEDDFDEDDKDEDEEEEDEDEDEEEEAAPEDASAHSEKAEQSESAATEVETEASPKDGVSRKRRAETGVAAEAGQSPSKAPRIN